MHYEYAVEPAAIAEDWKTCRYLSEMFGFDRGRVLSQFPKKWLPMAIDAAAHLPPLEKQRVIEKLRRLKEHASIRSGRPYDPALPAWIDNALAQQALEPFKAIIARDAVAGHGEIVIPDDVTETHPLFAVSRNAKISREAQAIADAVTPIVRIARKIMLVDKYYSPFRNEYQDTLRRILAAVSSEDPLPEIEIHYCEHARSPATTDIERDAVRQFAGVIPNNLLVKVFCWREKERGRNFHARYLLTERAGVLIDAGFSSEGAPQTTDIQLLEPDVAQQSREALVRTATVYELVGPILEVACDGTVKRV
jgi:hypothetical protein